MSGSVALIALTVIAFALVSRRLASTALSAPIVFVAAGLLLSHQVLDLVDLELELEAIDLLGEATLGVLLFADASRISLRQLREEYMLPTRLLAIGLPLTVAATTGILMLLIDGVDVWHAALIAAILSPTDAALGQEVVSNDAVPARIRQGLTVESGLNDGLIVPAVTLFLAFAVDEQDTESAAFWGRFVSEQVGLGLFVGVLVGGLGALALNRAQRSDWIDGLWAQLATFALAIAALATAIELGGNGFIATFVAGLVFGHLADDAEHLGEFTEDAAQLAAAISFFVFGNLLLGPSFDHLGPALLLCSLAVLTVARMIPVAVAMIGTGAAWQTRAFVGWFGPRGLASILFGIILLEEQLADAEELFAVVAWTVTLSVVLHGATAVVGARRYGEWWSSMSADDRAAMPESMPVAEQRTRHM
ncbi:MAG: cation:proton antiporter [Actinomycetota bacterium]